MSVTRKAGPLRLNVHQVSYYAGGICFATLYLTPADDAADPPEPRDWDIEYETGFREPGNMRLLSAVLTVVATDAEAWLAGGPVPTEED